MVSPITKRLVVKTRSRLGASIALLMALAGCAVPRAQVLVACDPPPVAGSGLFGARMAFSFEATPPAGVSPEGARVRLTDAEGHPLPGLGDGRLDSQGKATIENVPVGHPFVAEASLPAGGDRSIRLKTIIRTESGGAVSARMDTATTLATEAVLRGATGQVADIDLQTFQTLIWRVTERLTRVPAPSMADAVASQAWLQRAMAEDAELVILIERLRVQVNRPRPTPRPSATGSPAPSPSPVATATPPATPTPTPGVQPLTGQVSTVSTSLKAPYNVAIAPDGTLIVVHQGGLARVSATGVATPIGPGVSGVNGMWGATVDSLGNVYVADGDARLIRRVSPDGLVTTLATAQSAGQVLDVGDPASFKPWGIAVGPDGALYFADHGNHCIRRLSMAGEVSTVAGTGQPGFVDGPAESARFRQPMNLAFDQTGHLYVTDHGNGVVRRISPDGVVSTVAVFAAPSGIAIDRAGHVYAASAGSHTVYRLNGDGTITVVAGTPLSAGFLDGSGAGALFNGPFGLATGPDGAIYVADTWNNRLRVIR
jgi:sugar lactone lactonase YvrE